MQVSLQLDKNNGSIHKDQYTFFKIISRLLLLIMRNVSDKIVEKTKTQVWVQKIFFFRKYSRL